MKAARRAPRAHGITVVSFAAAATTDFIKRVFVFMIVSPSTVTFVRWDQYAKALGQA
tara:strand:- start:221 stop:391 length:171 start_codon:yes stop_codon:yes gene_type:complete